MTCDNTRPNYAHEERAIEKGYHVIAGVDEVGRGPLAGPVVAAAVILDVHNIPQGLNDSKKLSLKKRELLYSDILATSHTCIAQATVQEIDEINILQASHLAMRRALEGLKLRASYALIDGNRLPCGLKLPAQAIIKGDQTSLSIAAASIIAKVHRDRLMTELAAEFPYYGWEKNAGYPTKHHKEGLKCHGVSLHHRRSFRPIHNILWQDQTLQK